MISISTAVLEAFSESPEKGERNLSAAPIKGPKSICCCVDNEGQDDPDSPQMTRSILPTNFSIAFLTVFSRTPDIRLTRFDPNLVRVGLGLSRLLPGVLLQLIRLSHVRLGRIQVFPVLFNSSSAA
jgi:hypothetical protein